MNVEGDELNENAKFAKQPPPPPPEYKAPENQLEEGSPEQLEHAKVEAQEEAVATTQGGAAALQKDAIERGEIPRPEVMPENIENRGRAEELDDDAPGAKGGEAAGGEEENPEASKEPPPPEPDPKLEELRLKCVETRLHEPERALRKLVKTPHTPTSHVEAMEDLMRDKEPGSNIDEDNDHDPDKMPDSYGFMTGNLKGVRVRHVLDGYEGQVVSVDAEGKVRLLVAKKEYRSRMNGFQHESVENEEYEPKKPDKMENPALWDALQPLVKAITDFRVIRRSIVGREDENDIDTGDRIEYEVKTVGNPCLLQPMWEKTYPGLELPRQQLAPDEVELRFLVPYRNRVVYRTGDDGESAYERATTLPPAVPVERLDFLLEKSVGPKFQEMAEALPGRKSDFMKFF